jgi:hypothetical protein
MLTHICDIKSPYSTEDNAVMRMVTKRLPDTMKNAPFKEMPSFSELSW